MTAPEPVIPDTPDTLPGGPRLTVIAEGHRLDAVTAEPKAADGRRVRGTATRAHAVAAAAELFSTQGYSATSINAIATAAGVHNASLYHAFGSKEGILAAVVDHASSEFYEHLGWLDDVVTFDEAVQRLKGALLQRPLFLRMLLILVLERADPVLLETAADVRARGRALIRKILARELPPLADDVADRVLDDLSRLVMVFLDGVFFAGQIDADDATLARLFDVLTRAMHALIGDFATSA